MRAVPIGVFLALVSVVSHVAFAGDVPVWFEGDGKTYTADTLPDAVDAKSRVVLGKWLACLAESDVAYTAEVLEGGKGVFVFAPEIVVPEKREKISGSTRADRRRRLEAERKRKKKEKEERLANARPKQPPEVIRRERLAQARRMFDDLLPKPAARKRSATLWGRDVQRAQGEVPVLILVKDRADFVRVLDTVLASNQYLATYVNDVKQSKLTGVIIENPFVGVTIQQPDVSEEHKPHHELVKRQIELLLFQRFGPLPFFAREGIAWCFEWGALGRLRTFTGRTDFIGVGDPAYLGWPEERSKLYERGSGLAFVSDADLMEKLRAWRSDGYDDDLAAASFQLARCLLHRHSDKVSETLASWGAQTAEKRGSKTDSGGWLLDPDFVLAAEDLVEGLKGMHILESVRAFE
ncbi:MAG: hypothetical protein GY711_23185 [bacterium]|nr:hypothetical protein [bacterium]